MKKIIIVVFVLVAMATAAFGQKKEKRVEMISSTKLHEMRFKEIKEARKGLRKGVQIEPAELARIDSFYLPRIKAAEEREFALAIASAPTTPTTPATTVIKKTTSYVDYDTTGRADIVASASSETPVATPAPIPTPTSRKATGATVVYQGDQGAFSGESPSIKRGADAYAVVATADANAYLVRQMANGASATVNAPANQVGLEGTIINKYRFYELEVKIVGTNAGSVYNKTFLLGKDQSITDYLLPGAYQATIKAIGVEGVIYHNFVVAPTQINSVNGRNVFWVIYGGSDW